MATRIWHRRLLAPRMAARTPTAIPSGPMRSWKRWYGRATIFSTSRFPPMDFCSRRRPANSRAMHAISDALVRERAIDSPAHRVAAFSDTHSGQLAFSRGYSMRKAASARPSFASQILTRKLSAGFAGVCGFSLSRSSSSTYHYEDRKPIDVVRLTGGLREHLRFFHTFGPAISRKLDITGQAVRAMHAWASSVSSR